MAFAGGDLRIDLGRNRGEWDHFGPQFDVTAGGNAWADSGHSRQFSAAFPGLLERLAAVVFQTPCGPGAMAVAGRKRGISPASPLPIRSRSRTG